MPTEPVCPKCGDAGWIIIERANVSGAKPCDCRLQGRAGRMEGRAQIPPLYQNASFDNFVAPGPENPIARRELTNVLLAVKNFLGDFPDDSRPGLLLIGQPGTGKRRLLDRNRSGYDATSNSSDKEACRMALDFEVLLLDDLDAHRVTDWVEETVTSIATSRCNNRKALIATTNLPDGDDGSALIDRSCPLGKPECRLRKARSF